MRILQISHNHHIVGGSDRVFFATSELLKQAGHDVVPFCLSSPKDQPSQWSGYFPSGADSANPHFRDVGRYFYNRDARVSLENLLDCVGTIDVAHLHIYHGKLTPSILPVLKARRIPIVQTLHEYKLACPVYTLQRQGANCDACVEGSLLNCIRFRCKNGSVLRSAIMAAEMVSSRLAGDVRLVDRFICVSDFQKAIMTRAGLPRDKLVTLHNFVDSESVHKGHDGYLLYAGRIEALKGLQTLLTAVEGTDRKLVIAGDGAWVPDLRQRIRNQPQITYLGFQSGAALAELIRRAKAVVVPSEWYENCPMSVLEAKAHGRPVVASAIGGIPELVRDGLDGFLFDPGQRDDLIRALDRLDHADHALLSREARQDSEQRFSGRVHLARLLDVYRDAGGTVEIAVPQRKHGSFRDRSRAPRTERKPAAHT